MSGELAGILRERVAIARRDGERDAAGAATGGWRAVADAWAAVAPDGNGAIEVGEAIDAPPRWQLVLRTPADVVPGDRLRWGERMLRVRAVRFDPRRPDRVAIGCEEMRG